MATFQRKTLLNLSPLAREIALSINELDGAKRRLKRVLEHIGEVELDAQALRNKFPEMAVDERKARRERKRKTRFYGTQTLAELDVPFHDPLPLERQVLGTATNANA